MSIPTPPTGTGPLARREARLAWGLLFPTITVVSLVVILPLLAIFWISFKPVKLADLRAPEIIVREDLRGKPTAAGDVAEIRYRIRNSSQDQPITGVTLRDTLPDGLAVQSLDDRCSLAARELFCDFGDFAGKQREVLRIPVVVNATYLENGDVKTTLPVMTGEASFALTNFEFTLENFARVFDGDEFREVLWVTLFYIVVGTTHHWRDFTRYSAGWLGCAVTRQPMFAGRTRVVL